MADFSTMPEPPPIDYDDDWMAPPPDETYYMPDDPSGYDVFDDLPPEEAYSTGREAWLSPDQTIGNEPFPMPDRADEAWGWHDARLIGVERQSESGAIYEIGAIDLYAYLPSGDLGGTYLALAQFADVDVASAFYQQLQDDIHEQGLAAYEVPNFAHQQAQALKCETVDWQAATSVEYRAYEYLRGLETEAVIDRDQPPDYAQDALLQTALELGGVPRPQAPATQIEENAAFLALDEIGLEAKDFDLLTNPPPFLDAASGTAYWIGVFQPDRTDRDHCVTSILSLGRNPDSGALEAQLAPCVPGQWDKAYSAAEYLIQVAQKGGIERCFDAAEGMALATDQRTLWESERGVPLEAETTRDLADYTRSHWEVDL